MKYVFVVTWFKSENFGTCLQAYALNSVLKQSGYETIYLDRRTYYPLSKFYYSIKKVLNSVASKLNPTKRFNYGKYVEAHNCKVSKTTQLVSECYKTVSIRSQKDIRDIDALVDCYLVGSDQMWSPWMLSLQYLLDFVPTNSAKPKYSYAASFGVDNIPDRMHGVYRKYLSRFDHISVREPRAAELVKKMSGVKADVVLDPTFILTQDEWRGFSKRSTAVHDYDLNRYVLCYYIGSTEFNHLETAKQIARELNCKVALLPMKETDYQIADKDVTIIADACPYDFISLIDQATLVCTDSFHAVVFSFLMSTSFYSFPRFKKEDHYSQEARLQNVINLFSLQDSIWGEGKSRKEIIEHLTVDYSVGYETLNTNREKCIQFLEAMLEGRL